MVEGSRHFGDVAVAKGYDIHYQEFAGGHADVNWRGRLADGLIYLTHPENGRPSQKQEEEEDAICN